MNTIINTRFFLLAILLIVFNSQVLHAQSSSEKFVVVLDAGHGGKDPGNLGNGYKEKSIALNIVLEVGKELEKNSDIKVIYTRKTDVFIELRERAAIANKADADLFVSVHCDAFTNNAYGAGTFVLGLHKSQANFEIAKKENEVIFLEDNYKETYAGFDPSSPESLIGMTLMQEEYLDQSILLATLVQNNFTNKLKRKNRSVKQAGFWVLHNTYMPSVLIETGFLTNKAEGAYLNSKKGQSQMASAIKDAILDYKHSLDLNVGGNISTSEIDNSTVSIDESKLIYEGIIFKVQIAASSRKIEPKGYNFKGLDAISREDHETLYKYYYGSTSDYNEVKRLQKEAKDKGYNSCFIVAYKNGKQVSLADVLNSSAN
ncbi:N-acetylmuramoyl-L-alanine amidase [Hanstruepera ponticola]|uniref:N-acetylmuramoyl-L-alanine amidase n=1 Tax=Hanstruepera ponticola TaxID=2042995 RepID=UPI000CF1134E|nr:N-acetylmuramoyl-L-alanine amidase [Hanstruepera ponticola]